LGFESTTVREKCSSIVRDFNHGAKDEIVNISPVEFYIQVDQSFALIMLWWGHKNKITTKRYKNKQTNKKHQQNIIRTNNDFIPHILIVIENNST
jgi:hypothetical protein